MRIKPYKCVKISYLQTSPSILGQQKENNRKTSRIKYYVQALLTLLSNLCKNLLVSKQKILIFTNLDSSTAKLRKKNSFTSSDWRNNLVTLQVRNAGSDSNNLGMVELLDILLRDVKTRRGLVGGLDTLNKDAVKERNKAFGRF